MTKIFRYLIAFVFFFIFFHSVNNVWAGTFQLTKIGSLDTNGISLKHWWYSASQPEFQGTTLTSSQVNTTVDSTNSTTTADSSGNWYYTPPALTDGDHQVTFTSNGSTISFTLTIGKDIPANIGQPAANQTPVAGTVTPTLAIIAGGVLFLLCGIRLAKAKINLS